MTLHLFASLTTILLILQKSQRSAVLKWLKHLLVVAYLNNISSQEKGSDPRHIHGRRIDVGVKPIASIKPWRARWGWWQCFHPQGAVSHALRGKHGWVWCHMPALPSGRYYCILPTGFYKWLEWVKILLKLQYTSPV